MAAKRIQYKIVESKADSFEKEVNKLCDEGWAPIGGVTVHKAFDHSEVKYYQAMIKEVESQLR